MITDLKATTEAVLKAGGKLPRYLTNLEAKQRRAILKSECRRLGITPVSC